MGSSGYFCSGRRRVAYADTNTSANTHTHDYSDAHHDAANNANSDADERASHADANSYRYSDCATKSDTEASADAPPAAVTGSQVNRLES